jgi:hypothetical protein
VNDPQNPRNAETPRHHDRETAPMNGFHIIRRAAVSRRTFLRGAGVALGLPWLDAMVPALAGAAETAAAMTPPRRFVAMHYGLGFHTPFLTPKTAGADFELTPYLEPLKDHRDRLTVLSGLSHPEQRGANGHTSELTWLTGAKHPGLPGFRNTISLDQLLAERLGHQTRVPFLSLSATGSDGLSWTQSGVNLPADGSPSRVFAQLFVNGSPAEVKRQVAELKRGRSILDTVRGEARKLDQQLGARDREKMDQYLTAVRDLETRIQGSEQWAVKPKPAVEGKTPVDVADRTDIIAKTRLMHDLIRLALQTDSTRIITYKAGGMNAVPKIEGVSNDWHQLSHHGLDPAKIAELKTIELAEFREIGRFLGLLRESREGGGTLLDSTAVLFGSNLGNASSHDATNLPLVLAGGTFRHGRHLAFDPKSNGPFAGVFLSLAEHMGVRLDSFSYATAPLKGLERA